jgi:hypothetical protein
LDGSGKKILGSEELSGESVFIANEDSISSASVINAGIRFDAK